MIAYVGEPITLQRLLLDPEHSLERQAWAPRYQTHGVVNADGFGVGWWDHAVRREPALYRRTQPIWADTSFRSLAGIISARAVVAAVRSATPGFTLDEAATPPFAAEEWLFAHNGLVEGWRDEAGAALRALVSQRRAAALRSTVDSELLFALTLGRLDAGATPAEALAGTVTTAKEIAGGRFTCLLSDGRSIIGTTFGNTLFTRHDAGGVVVASEPFDGDSDWVEVPDMSLVIADADVEITPI